MAFEDVLVHEARVVSVQQTGPRRQGERQSAPQEGPVFNCLLQFDAKGTERDRRGAQGVRVFLLYGPEDRLGGKIRLNGKERLEVRAEELTGPDYVEWQVDGRPVEMAPPGSVIGYECELTRETD